MLYSTEEYAKTFLICGKRVSARSIQRRCKNGQLPSNHIATKMKGKTGQWIIQVKDKK